VSWIEPRIAPGDPQQFAVRGDDGLEVHAVHLVLAGVKRPVDAVALDADQGAVEDHEGVPSAFGAS
jgi:hypothetical protein